MIFAMASEKGIRKLALTFWHSISVIFCRPRREIMGSEYLLTPSIAIGRYSLANGYYSNALKSSQKLKPINIK